jgi:hypothetical protein
MRLRLLFKPSIAAVPMLLMLPVAAAPASAAAPAAGCSLPSSAGVKHVVYVQFDNVHLRRDNPNVPSDVEQMPNLLNFLQGGGALLDNHHTPLISHTADDILTSLTGVYGDRQGNPVSNSYLQFNAAGTPKFVSSFQYWTDRTPNGTPNMLSAAGKTAPAPWTAYARAGCNVGAVGMANIELENLGDVAQVYGPNSPEAAEVNSHSPNAFPDFVGIGVHCAKGSAVCSSANHGIADTLVDEPGGYSGFNMLQGSKFVAPQISSGPVRDLDGNVIADRFNGGVIPGFPGFDGMNASVSLGYTAAMQEHGVPVTFSYISSAHVDENGNDAGPGQAGYVARLKSYDQAWGKFFSRLQGDGINRSNTLFVVTADENDHFAGGTPSPAGCDGVHTACTYSKIGEAHVDLPALMQQAGSTTAFNLHSDDAPAAYLNGQPARDAAVTRSFERTMDGLQVTNPISGRTESLVNQAVDPVGLNLLHMVTADQARTPTFVAFAKPDYFVDTGPDQSCAGGPVVECPPSAGTDAWMHGGNSPEIVRTWLGIAGPGVQHLGRNSSVWSDHSDIRPTMLLLSGIADRYQHEGRPLFELLTDRALPASLRTNRADVLRLAQAFKQINAPVGELGVAGTQVSAAAIASGSAGNDGRYAELESSLASITAQRNALAGQMIGLIEGAAFNGRAVGEDRSERLVEQARELIERTNELARSTGED